MKQRLIQVQAEEFQKILYLCSVKQSDKYTTTNYKRLNVDMFILMKFYSYRNIPVN